jgi:hypothetical protein
VEIGKQIAAGKNVMVFYSFKVEKMYWPSMHQIMSTICHHGGIDEDKDTVMHYGDMDGAEKALILNDLNKHWRKRVVMTNSAVTAGVDFAQLWFHRLYACVSGFQNPREIIQCLSRARHIIDNEVFVVKISPSLRPKHVPDMIETDPLYTTLIKSCNTELHNNARRVLECYAIDTGYDIKADKLGFSAAVTRLAEETELHHDLGLKYENIEAISANKAEFLRQKVTSQAVTSKEMLCLEKYYFDRLFLDEVAEDDRVEFWNGRATRAAHAMREYRKPNCPLRAKLLVVTARIDEILS